MKRKGNPMKTKAVGACVFLLLCCAAVSTAEELHSWTGAEGGKIEATLLEFDGEVVKMRLKSDREVVVPVDFLTKEDRVYVRNNHVLKDDPRSNYPGRELLGRTKFDKDFLPTHDTPDCVWHPHGTKSVVSNKHGVLVIECHDRSDERWWAPQLTFNDIELKKGAKYVLSVEIKSEKPGVFYTDINNGRPPYEQLGLGGKMLTETHWKAQHYPFTATKSEPVTRLTLQAFEKGNTFEIRKVSLRETEVPKRHQRRFPSVSEAAPRR